MATNAIIFISGFAAEKLSSVITFFFVADMSFCFSGQAFIFLLATCSAFGSAWAADAQKSKMADAGQEESIFDVELLPVPKQTNRNRRPYYDYSDYDPEIIADLVPLDGAEKKKESEYEYYYDYEDETTTPAARKSAGPGANAKGRSPYGAAWDQYAKSAPLTTTAYPVRLPSKTDSLAPRSASQPAQVALTNANSNAAAPSLSLGAGRKRKVRRRYDEHGRPIKRKAKPLDPSGQQSTSL
ncbi:hypothetical protein HDE_14287 [Halotydeus destructor]|nr:hypothetical protein HDE_14287 [Halotydeus destructor]